MRTSRFFASLLLLLPALALAAACAAAGADPSKTFGAGGGGGEGGSGGAGSGGSGAACDTCLGNTYTPCTSEGKPGAQVLCPKACAPGKGCVTCIPGSTMCVGNEVHKCAEDGSGPSGLVATCNVGAGETCSDGICKNGCDVAADQPSNIGCEFWAVDLDQQDAINDPASAPWGVVLSNAGQAQANVTIEMNEAPVGEPPKPVVVKQVSVPPSSLISLVLPTRELDCGTTPNDYKSPGTCLSSNAYRITSSAPIVVYQFNVFTNAYSNDASLLLPTNALGQVYRVIGWPAGHPAPVPGFNIIDRSYVTIVGVKPNTQVTVKPSWRIRGNPPIAATQAGGEIVATIGPFDVLNLETDDATLGEDPTTVADLSATLVTANQPVAVFSGVESTAAPGAVLEVPTPPGWDSNQTCCLDHLEEQMFPVESIGTEYVVTRSPIRSTTGFREPDVLRFVGAAEEATVTTSLPPPFDSFPIAPGEVKTTWTQDNVVVSATKPVMVGQILISNQYVDGAYIGDPSLTVFPPIEQFRTEYVILTPESWTQNWVVIAAETGAKVYLDGEPTTSCETEASGKAGGKAWESRRCPLTEGVHQLTGDLPFGIVAYGYGSAGSYAFVGGADVKRVYEPPPLK